MSFIKLIPHDTKIDFVGQRKLSFAISIMVVVGTIISFMFHGLNYGIDFRGGLVLEIRTPMPSNLSALRDKLSSLVHGEVSLQQFGTPRDVLVKIERQPGGDDAQEIAVGKIRAALDPSIEYRRVETVGPKVGAELIQNGVTAIAWALVAMLAYLWFRFEWQFGLCAMVALTHDCFAIIGMYTLFPMEFNETAIIAILLTASYSVNDTVVIYDRIRENLRKYKKTSLGEVVNRSLNETLSRTVLTASTTLLALLALYLFGGKVISAFSLPIIIGILVGIYSSVFVASPLLLYLGLRAEKEDGGQVTGVVIANS